MRKHLFLLIAIISMAFPDAGARSQSRSDVEAAVAQLRTAMIAGDSTALQELLADSLSYGHSGGRVETKTELIHELATGLSDFVTMDLTDQTVQVSGDVAIVRHSLSADTNDRGVASTVKLSVMLVWQRQHKHWKLLARQAVKAH